MFDFAWSEFALIGVVALVLIGPKDMPVAIKAITGAVKKARKMAAEFQTHVDDLVRDADLHEVRDQVRQLRGMDIRGTIARAVDSDGSIRQAFKDPIRTPPPPVVTEPDITVDVPVTAEHTIVMPPPEPVAAPVAQSAYGNAPAFIPPELTLPPVVPPAFIPPDTPAPSSRNTAAAYGRRA